MKKIVKNVIGVFVLILMPLLGMSCTQSVSESFLIQEPQEDANEMHNDSEFEGIENSKNIWTCGSSGGGTVSAPHC